MIQSITSEFVFVCGDSHGNWEYIANKLERYKITNVVIIHVGDFGVGFMKKEYENYLLNELNDKLKKNNNYIYTIRGNHDNPTYFSGDYDKFTNITFVPDYSVLRINNKDWLLIGGAISIDRQHRIISALQTNKISYWHNEKIFLEENNENRLREISEEYDIKYVVTHTCPSICFPKNDTNNQKNSHGPLVERFTYYDKELKDDLNAERQICDKILEIVSNNNKIEKWFYGHFHDEVTQEINGIEFNLLNINQIKEL